eukprot:m51a1_g12268 hypothetical protein (326) ;mRNA; r:211680-212731
MAEDSPYLCDLVTLVRGSESRHYPLRRFVYRLGSSPRCDVVFRIRADAAPEAGACVEAVHALLFVDSQTSVYIMSCSDQAPVSVGYGDTRATLAPRTAVPLGCDDVVRMGAVRFRVVPHGAASIESVPTTPLCASRPEPQSVDVVPESRTDDEKEPPSKEEAGDTQAQTPAEPCSSPRRRLSVANTRALESAVMGEDVDHREPAELLAHTVKTEEPAGPECSPEGGTHSDGEERNTLKRTREKSAPSGEECSRASKIARKEEDIITAEIQKWLSRSGENLSSTLSSRRASTTPTRFHPETFSNRSGSQKVSRQRTTTKRGTKRGR